MELIVRTIMSAHLVTCKLLNRPFTVLENSTLNQKFNLNASEVPNVNEYPVLGYIGIGNHRPGIYACHQLKSVRLSGSGIVE